MTSFAIIYQKAVEQRKNGEVIIVPLAVREEIITTEEHIRCVKMLHRKDTAAARDRLAKILEQLQKKKDEEDASRKG